MRVWQHEMKKLLFFAYYFAEIVENKILKIDILLLSAYKIRKIKKCIMPPELFVA